MTHNHLPQGMLASHFADYSPHPWNANMGDRLLAQRVIVLGHPIDDQVANDTIAALVYLDAIDPAADIRLLVNTPSGSIRACLAIADAMSQLESDIVTICTGQAGEVTVVLLASGTSGRRYAMPHARIRLHYPQITIHDVNARDLEAQANELLTECHQINQRLAERSHQSLSHIEQMMRRGHVLSAQEALTYGLIDQIVSRL
jgi:ATP-dependent Clp protease protease subunit